MDGNKPLQAAKTGYLILSALLCVLGIALLAVPGFSIRLLGILLGCLMIAFGGIKVLGYFSRDLYRLAFQFDLAFGVLMMILGLVLILRTEQMIRVLCMIWGICVLADALLKIQISLDAKGFGIGKWWLILSVALLTGVAGLMLILRPWDSARLIAVLLGLTLIAEGLLNLITTLTAVKIWRKPPGIVDAVE